MRMEHPPHPGGFVKTEVIEARGVAVTDAATVLDVGDGELTEFLNGRAGRSPDLAVRIRKAFGVRMDTLLRMQNSWDLARTRHLEFECRSTGSCRRMRRARSPHDQDSDGRLGAPGRDHPRPDPSGL